MLTKWADWQSVEKARKQGPQRSSLILEWARAIFAVAGLVSALGAQSGGVAQKAVVGGALRCHSLFSYAAGVCAGAVGVTLAAGAEGSAVSSICTGVMISPPRTTKFSASGKR